MNETDQKVRQVSGPLQAERLPDGGRRLVRALILKVRDEEIVVPAGFVSDFRSLPRGQFTRCETDTIWRLTAQSGGSHANSFQAWLGWLLIRLGARFAWDRARKKSRLA